MNGAGIWMLSVLLGCSLPEVDSSPVDTDTYEPRDNPFTEDSTVDGPPEAWSGDLHVQVSDATHEDKTCDGRVELSVTGPDVAGSGKCLLATGLVTKGNELTLEFLGSWSPSVHGSVYAYTDDDSFSATWFGSWPSDTEMLGEFSVAASELGAAYDGRFLLTQEE